MSYVDALYDRNKDRIHIVERKSNGERVYQDFPAQYVMYYETTATLETSSLVCGYKLSHTCTSHLAEKHLALSYLKSL